MKKTGISSIIIYILVTMLVISGGLYLPGFFLNIYTEKNSNILSDVPTEYYIGKNSAISSMASVQLSEYEKIQLISNSWEGESSSVSAEFSSTDAYSMVQLTKSKLQDYYKAGLYPFSFVSKEGDDWYSYDAKRYCSTDTTFKIFSAYYWLITLTKYNSSETHTVLITESGTILYAFCSSRSNLLTNDNLIIDIANKYTSLSDFSVHPSSFVQLDDNTDLPTYREVEFPNKKTSVGVIVIGDNKITNEDLLNYSYGTHHSQNSFEYYYAFQYRDLSPFHTNYAIGIIPYTN